jgi:hypothetical protein
MASAPMAQNPTAAAPMAAPTRDAPMSAAEECDFTGRDMKVIVERRSKVKAHAERDLSRGI